MHNSIAVLIGCLFLYVAWRGVIVYRSVQAGRLDKNRRLHGRVSILILLTVVLSGFFGLHLITTPLFDNPFNYVRADLWVVIELLTAMYCYAIVIFLGNLRGNSVAA